MVWAWPEESTNPCHELPMGPHGQECGCKGPRAVPWRYLSPETTGDEFCPLLVSLAECSQPPKKLTPTRPLSIPTPPAGAGFCSGGTQYGWWKSMAVIRYPYLRTSYHLYLAPFIHINMLGKLLHMGLYRRKIG